tara:strand:+ start:124 stop:453 length:330 start_codon:yes stop_codon:yes gene_type:complete
MVGLGYRGRQLDKARVLHKGRPKQLMTSDWRWLKRRQTVEPVIGHLKSDTGCGCHLKDQLDDTLNAVVAAAGYNLRWLMRRLFVFCGWILASLLGRDDREDHETLLLPA